MKESEKINKYLDLGQLKKLWNMKLIVIPILVGMFGIIHLGLRNQRKELGIYKPKHC